MAELGRHVNEDRIKAAIGVAALHALLFYALLIGLGAEVVREAADRLAVFDIPKEPSPPRPIPPERSRDAPEGAPAPPNLRSRPAPVVAPPPRVRLEVPPPVLTAPEPAPGPPGSDRTAGSADVAGPGTGAGGQGSGTGGGGLGGRAVRVSGSLSGATDYPPALRRAGVEGTVRVRFTVRTDGRVGGCVVTGSSGHAELDSTTCRLIEQRFRYRPARDAQGRPVPELVTRTFDWLLPMRN